MSLFKTTVIAGLLAATTATGAFAQQANTPADENFEEMQMADRGEDDGMGRHHGKHGRGHGGRHMRIIDANADGVIGEDEAASVAERMFMRLDRDRDGTIVEAEFTTPHHHGWRAWFGQDEAEAVTKVRKEKFAALDTDKNLGISKVEFMADAKAKLAAADTDKDGKVSPFEFRAQN